MKNLIVFLFIGILLSLCGEVYSQERVQKQSRKERKAKALRTESRPEVREAEQPVRVAPAEKPDETREAVPGQGREEKTDRQLITLEQLAPQAAPVVEQRANGSINWTEQYIEAKGQSVIDNERYKNPAQAKLMAQRGAVVVAQRNLLEITQGVSVTSETTVKDMITENDYIYTRIDGVIKNAQQVGEAIEKDGYVEVTMRIPIYDTDGLAPVLHDKLAASRRGTDAEVTEEGYAMYMSSEIELEEALGGTEGLVFDFKGRKIDPSMFPVVVDDKGKVLLDFYNLYDPREGKFPKVVQQSKEVFDILEIDKKNLKILEVAESFDGKFVLDEVNARKINWKAIGKAAAKAGKILTFALALI